MTLEALVADARAWPDRVVDEALPKIGQVVKKAVLDTARADVGSDLRLRNMGRVKIDAGYEIEPPVVVLTPRPAGPWMLLEAGSHKAGWWIPRKRRGRRRRIRVGSSVRWYVRHGPVRPKRTWTRARAAATKEIPAVIAEVAEAATRELAN